jgi:DNA-binding Xre family transcriptional regulator
MIKTEKEYLEAKKRVASEFEVIEQHRLKMEKEGMSKKQISLAVDPLHSFALQLQEEVEEYEKLKRGDFDIIENLYGLGRSLVALRIYKGVKQKYLAEKLGVTEAQISRDERNEYRGASLERLQKVFDALGATSKTQIEVNFKDAI